LQKEATLGINPENVVDVFDNKYSWNQLLRYLLPWIYEKCASLSNYLSMSQSKRDVKGKKVIPIKPTVPAKVSALQNLRLIEPTSKRPHPNQLNSNSNSNSDSDSDSEDEEEAFDVGGIAQIIAYNRSPKRPEIRAKQTSTHLPSSQPSKHSPLYHKSKPVNKPAPPAKRKKTPLFIPSESEDEPLPQQSPPINNREDSPFELFQRFTGASQRISGTRHVPSEAQRHLTSKSISPVPHQPHHPRQSTTVKRSIFDEQPDARRISFDSQSRKSGSSLPRPLQSRKRRRPTSSDDDEEDFVTYDRPVNRDRLEHSRTSAAARRPDPTEVLLDRIHGAVHDSPDRDRVGGGITEGMAVRKGRGFEWSVEQERVLIEQIEIYGPAWADIARKYCRPGMIFEGRDQTKLKDKARNIKEKYIRYELHFLS
jgi:hypothetical protein